MSQAWCIRGGTVFDRLFGTRYAKDIDLVYEGARPSDADVRRLTQRDDLPIDAIKTVFPRTEEDYIL